MQKTTGLPLPRSARVLQDWRLPLPADKSIPFLHTLHLLETCYSIFSVNLDEAIALRRRGQLNKSYIALSITPSLCERLGSNLQALLRSMLAQVKHFRVIPSLCPLDPDNFQLPLSRRAAHFSNLCSRVILSRRSQFRNKMSTLLDLVGDLENAFSGAVGELKDATSVLPEQEWSILDSAHYDLNTCLRESIVLLKCFLHALPEDHLPDFVLALQERPVSLVPRVFAPKRHLAHRRMALLKGQ